MQKALAPEISTWPDESPQLIGSTCGGCGATAFPVQRHCPKCSVGEMPERVEGRLTENDPAKVQFGQRVELTMVPFTTDDDDNEIVTFAFKPV
jgi:uncharacterized OB-fold protein